MRTSRDAQAESCEVFPLYCLAADGQLLMLRLVVQCSRTVVEVAAHPLFRLRDRRHRFYMRRQASLSEYQG